ncbi:12084_t:CDS:2, partial [Racocetra fulgida]
MSTLPTDSFKISITTTTTTELTSQPSQPTSSPEPEITVSLDVTTPENITKNNSQISTLYANQELNRSATSLSSADYIVPSNDPRSSTQIFKLQDIDYSNFEGIIPLGYGKSITILVSTWKNDNDMIKVALKKVESLAAFSQALKEDSNDSENLGISKSIPQKSSIYPSLPYIDPNYFASPTLYPRDKHLDIYSLGVIMHDISSGKRPFENLPYNQFLAIRLFEGLRLKPINGTPLELVDLYEQCWDIDASIRPTISDILARLGRLKLDSLWVDNDEMMGNHLKKNFENTMEYNGDIKGIIMETKHVVFGSGNVTFSNGNISSIRDIEINENEIY